MTLNISYEAELRLHIPYRKIAEEVVSGTLDYLGCPYEAQVSLSIVDDEEIRQVNRDFRQTDAVTDVLSFPMNEFPEPGNFGHLIEDPDAFDPDTGELVLGDIMIDAGRVLSQAEEYGHTRTREYAFLVCHSVLHLCGYDHMEETERAEMEELQKTILNALGYRR